jgi:hypothetical protein
VKGTFKDAWHLRLPASDDLPHLLPDIENATPTDRQVAVYPPPNWGTAAAGKEPELMADLLR